MICGGMMSGNCAIGSAPMATSPARTVTMAMTMATMGRPMKKRDICQVPCPALARPGRRRWRNEGFRIHYCSVPRRGAFDDNAGARVEALLDDPAAADTLTRRHRPRGHDVVLTHDAD